VAPVVIVGKVMASGLASFCARSKAANISVLNLLGGAAGMAKNQNREYGLFEYMRQEAEKLKTRQGTQSVEGPNFRNQGWRSSW
jgi:hypothetical protein